MEIHHRSTRDRLVTNYKYTGEITPIYQDLVKTNTNNRSTGDPSQIYQRSVGDQLLLITDLSEIHWRSTKNLLEIHCDLVEIPHKSRNGWRF